MRLADHRKRGQGVEVDLLVVILDEIFFNYVRAVDCRIASVGGRLFGRVKRAHSVDKNLVENTMRLIKPAKTSGVKFVYQSENALVKAVAFTTAGENVKGLVGNTVFGL